MYVLYPIKYTFYIRIYIYNVCACTKYIFYTICCIYIVDIIYSLYQLDISII